jgi:hypothetical protein
MTSSNPTRTLKCVVLGTNSVSYVGISPSYTEADGVLPSPNCPDLPAGVDVASVTVYETYNGEDHQLYQESTTPEYQTAQTLYPDCSSGTCMLDLRTAAGVSCFQNSVSCADWFSDPDKATKYGCFYGPHSVALEECSVYAPTFMPEKQGSGDVLGDPDGNMVGAPSGAPNGRDAELSEKPVQEPGSRQCLPTGWGVLNPIEWVMRPMQCALEWAFVPRTSFLNAMNSRIQNVSANTFLANANTMITAFTAPFEIASTGCQGPPMPISWHFGGGAGFEETYYPLSACEGFMASFASLINGLTQGVIFVGAALAAIKYFASIVGFVGYGALGSTSSKSGSTVKFK